MTNEAFIVGSSLYRMSIQMLVAKAVLQDPDQYARILHNNTTMSTGLNNSSKNPTVKGIKRFVTETIYYIRQWGIDLIEI
jgi:hypothetical protein